MNMLYSVGVCLTNKRLAGVQLPFRFFFDFSLCTYYSLPYLTFFVNMSMIGIFKPACLLALVGLLALERWCKCYSAGIW